MKQNRTNKKTKTHIITTKKKYYVQTKNPVQNQTRIKPNQTKSHQIFRGIIIIRGF